MSVTVLEGSSFYVADDDGNVEHGSEGLYSNDVRHLSRWRLTINGLPPQLLANGSTAHHSAACYGQLAAHIEPGAPTIATIRRLFVTTGSLQEQLEILNVSAEPASLLVGYEFDCDFLDLFEVKSTEFGTRDLAFTRTITPLLSSRDYDRAENVYTFTAAAEDFSARTLIWFSERGVAGNHEMYFEVEIAPHTRWALRTHIVVLSGPQRRSPRYPGEYFGLERRRARHSLRTWNDRAPVLRTNLHPLGETYRQTIADLGALRMKPGQGDEHGQLPAAGLPWFMTVFGRDTAIVSLQTLLLGPELATSALRTLAHLQSTFDDAEKDAEPGKIVHEMRFGKVAALTRSFPYYGSVDSTPLFLLVLHETWRWTGDAELMRELEPAARAALAWIEGPGDVDGYVAYHRRSKRGLESQSWKDSWNSMLFADGRLAKSPLAPCEVQGYAYAARLGLAEIARACFGDPALAARLEADAADLKARFNRDYWVEGGRHGGHFALALDRDRAQVDSLTSNVGHLLYSGIVADELTNVTASALLSSELFSGWALRTMSTTDAGYNPIEYHNGTVWPHDTSIACSGLARAGYRDEAARLFVALLDAAEHFGWRLPEVLAGYPRSETVFPIVYPTACSPQAWASAAPVMALRAVLGIEPDPASRSLTVAAEVSIPDLELTLTGVPAFGHDWLIEVAGGRATTTRLGESDAR